MKIGVMNHPVFEPVTVSDLVEAARAKRWVSSAFPAMSRRQYEGDSAHYLFYSDETWTVKTDTWHPSLDDAKRQGGVSETWQ
jgi:hypothetical protein